MDIEEPGEKIVADLLSLPLCLECRRAIEGRRIAILRTHDRGVREVLSATVELALFELREKIQRRLWKGPRKDSNL